MGNIFTNDEAGPHEAIQLSNGGTSVFVALILLAGVSLARSHWEKEFLIWFAQENDQSIHGIGMVGVDISHFGWTHEDLENEKSFILNIIDKIFQTKDWRVLDYKPQVGYLEKQLLQLEEYVLAFKSTFILADSKREFYEPSNTSFDKCQRHGIYLYSEGCYICNDR